MLNEEIYYASPPNVRYLRRLQEAYREAKEGKKRLWGPR
jgi:hypothetical protein